MKPFDRFSGWAAVFLAVALATGVFVLKVLPFVYAPGRVNVTVTFPDATGLSEGDDVRCDGTLVGRVSTMRIQDREVAVDLWLRLPSPLRKDARFALVSKSVLGGTFVDVDPGTGRLADETTRFRGRGAVFILDSLGALFTGKDDGEPGLVENLEQAAEAVEEKRGLLGEIFDSTSEFRVILDDLSTAFSAEGVNLLGVLFDDSEFHQAVTDIGAIFEGLEEENTAAGVLVALLMRPESEPAKNVDAIGDALAHLSEVYEAGGGSTRLFDMKGELWQRLGTFQKDLNPDSAEAPGKEAKVGFLLDVLSGESGDLLGTLKASFGEAAEGAEGAGETRSVADLLGEDSELKDLFGSVFLFFGYGSSDVRDRAYALQFYSLLKFFDVLSGLRDD